MNLEKLAGILAFGVLLAVFVAQGMIEYHDQKAALVEYCGNVKKGEWPDYKGAYKEACEENFGPIAKKFELKLDTNQF